ncbi:hypothetical protein BC834DRAFT_847129 [Gloeopeniophorella convolvens]|nr:hypothetical protein BC834DRAFT_847129 [Gloeopeniophorella convolvens]
MHYFNSDPMPEDDFLERGGHGQAEYFARYPDQLPLLSLLPHLSPSTCISPPARVPAPLTSPHASSHHSLPLPPARTPSEHLLSPRAPPGPHHRSPALSQISKATSPCMLQGSPCIPVGHMSKGPRTTAGSYSLPPSSHAASLPRAEPERLWCQACTALSLARIDLHVLEEPLATVPVHQAPGPCPSLLDAYKAEALTDKRFDTRRLMIGKKTLAQIIQYERYDAFLHLYNAILAKMREFGDSDVEMSSSGDEA